MSVDDIVHESTLSKFPGANQGKHTLLAIYMCAGAKVLIKPDQRSPAPADPRPFCRFHFPNN